MAEGTIDRIDFQFNQSKGTGWGNYVVVLHADGSRSLYAHLERAILTVGDTVSPGTVIGLADNTGGSSAPHLHVEYAPSGKIFQKKGAKVDPHACIGRLVSGAITIRDNGSLADDAFSVAINNAVVCQTAIGQANNCAVGSLRPGTVNLTVTALVAPDNVGTYEISLSSGLTFSDGTTTRSGTLPQGGSVTFVVNVPTG